MKIHVEDLMLYHSAPSKLSEATLYSQNAPMNHEMNDTAKKLFNSSKRTELYKSSRTIAYYPANAIQTNGGI